MITSLRHSLLALLSILALSSTFTNPVQAHSTALPIITRSEHVRSLRHDILPRIASYTLHRDQPLAKRTIDQRLTASPEIITKDDTIRLQFNAFNTTFHLYLEPNTDLIHPDADLGPDNIFDDIKPFKGVVIEDQQYSDQKWKRAATTSRITKRTIEHMQYEEGIVGWARMTVEHDANSADNLILRGAFMVKGDTYHVTTKKTYHVQKRSEDALPTAATSFDSSLIIFRDSDLYRPALLAKNKRGLNAENVVCGSDHMLNKTASYIEATSSHGYYYPPDVLTTVPMARGSDMSSSWMDVLTSPLTKRQVTVQAAGPNPVPEGCPTNRLVTYMGVAADCAYVREHGGQSEARKQIFANFNTASEIYESTFNVALGIISLNIKSENCPTTPVAGEEWNQDCSPSYSIDKRLSDFSRWRGADDRPSDGAGLWHLMTKCNTGAVVGIAWTKALCQASSQRQGTGVSSSTPTEWMVVAHEIGHGFGAIHDCTAQSCPADIGQCCPLSATTCNAGGQYIMNPSEQSATRVFSPCSIRAICGTIQSSSGRCLQPPGTRQTQNGEANICGNGIKETGEDCDCGSPEECAKDPCCDGTTCKFKAGAVCDDLNDDCCLNCQLRPTGYVCRQAISECDIQEVCSGTSGSCPADVKLPDLTPCKGSNNATGLQCANGVCTSRDLQCRQQDRQGITKQCEASNSCDLMCNDPSGSALRCMQIPGTYFIDGTPCGFGGTCSGGKCAYSNGINGVLNWAKNHLSIVIPVACVIGLILLCCIWGCCCSGTSRRRRQKKMTRRPSSVLRPSGSFRSRTAPLGAQHTGQHYPMGALSPPPPTYHDPSILLRNREEQQLQRALEESRREYETHSHTLNDRESNNFPSMPEPQSQSQSQNGATVVSTPVVRTSPLPAFDHTNGAVVPATVYNNNIISNNSSNNPYLNSNSHSQSTNPFVDQPSQIPSGGHI
ncbi:Metallo-peptidase family M12-domain-containing protein [Lobosporangium transversale]|uniref:Metallo-peptidase family M12-domain-containing protein n=1 Tax=Lobosporangium transversale TaxID=64571 RepID=A0A1Y2H0Z2_9FUNG|nr:Metallo-peptidase family M12-domain-containing protein [Lobosporangium transversale]ORZ27671.1 Metallo-peptidase family M12-domain-containing protein [Lobosporangium transversale]|eukprot:XP_021885374.1 Metallo-peptidase family M12-domain-containing protein [Lobosporangium transversale]